MAGQITGLRPHLSASGKPMRCLLTFFCRIFGMELPRGKMQNRGFKKTKGKTQELFLNYMLTEISCFLPFVNLF
jgi:hypothetical protein